MTASHPDGVTLVGFADGTLPPGSRADVAAHLSVCLECRAVVDDLRRVQAAVRQLPPLEPPHNAWPRIERALRASGAARRHSRWPWLAAAAAVTLVAVGGLKFADTWRHRTLAVETASTVEAPSAQSIEAELRQAEQHYQKAIAGLEQIANAEKGSLDPQVAATLEKNLAVVDQAISESRAALKTQPASEPAQTSLLESFKAKIALLQDTVALINEMRKVSGSNTAEVSATRKGS
jgi:anti-sigma factor ChrR (cupin superfamily)